MSDKHIVVNIDGYNALVAERDRLAAELARARQQAKFWHDKADKRGDELKAIYSQQSKEAKCEKQS